MNKNYGATYILHLDREKMGGNDGIDAFRNINMQELSSMSNSTSVKCLPTLLVLLLIDKWTGSRVT